VNPAAVSLRSIGRQVYAPSIGMRAILYGVPGTDNTAISNTLSSMFSAALVNLYTGNIEAGIRFYRDLLGFRETFRTPRDGRPEHIEFQLNGFTLGLGTVEAARRVHGVEASPGSPAMVLVVWTDDVDKAYREMVNAGVPSLRPPHDTGNNNRNALLRDPDGNLVEIVAKRS
jgi:lactoylglutathione lyase